MCSCSRQRTEMRESANAEQAETTFAIALLEEREILPLDNLRQFLTKLDEMFCGSSNIFMDALLENDECCMQTMAAIQRLNSNTKNICCTKLDVQTALAPDILALHCSAKSILTRCSSAIDLPNCNHMNCSNFVPPTSKCQTPKVNDGAARIVSRNVLRTNCAKK
ncbi:hypothetical protein GPALN_014455 [Globodera pallida]|nr:hypothetical protein GPALN_014455 [Globodera pallida]